MSLRTACALLTASATLAVPAVAQAADAADCPGSLDAPTASNASAAADAITCLVNQERAQRGMKQLSRDSDLTTVARRQANDMVRRTYFSHVTPGGSDLGDRLRAVGYGSGHSWRAGEALGWGTGDRATPNALVDEWLASPPHRKILLDRGFREIGVGVTSGAPEKTDGDLPGATYALDLGVER
jgi:uncharacterized protein YkwD